MDIVPTPRRAAVLLLAAATWTAPVRAEAPGLAVPVDCAIGRACFIQNYADAEPGPGARDHMCGHLTYDGHAGTDFRVPDLAAMRRGVAVTAAAAGRVSRVRDGMEDTGIHDAGREAGNAVVIEHGDGWETQYSHLRKGSVAVRPGDRVTAGQTLGLIGMSGNTAFPHVDFAVRHDGKPVDPFVGTVPATACGGSRTPLWHGTAAESLTYRATGVLNAGFAAEPPVDAKARDGGYATAAPERDAPVLGFWGELFGGQTGDRLSLRIHGPDGREVQRGTATVPKPLAVLFLATVANRPAAGWPAGVYQGHLSITRNGAVVAEAERRIEIR